MKHIFTSILLTTVSAASAVAQQPSQPNIVLIMCDDMGFSDIGCYGGEIQTPNIDKLAQRGVRFSQFTNTGRSCPSRAALLTGRYQHEVGMGWMTAVDEHRPGYRGQISQDYPTIAEIMKHNGYSTYMSGKWHLTLDGSYGTPNGSMPVQRGFDRYFGCLTGGGSYYKPKQMYNNLTYIDANSLPEDFYYTTAITDSAVHFINQHDARRSPMFMYVAYYAPHYPLQAPADRVERCRQRYCEGYDVLRRRRFERQKQLGLFPKEATLPEFDYEFDGKRPAWTDLTEEQQQKWIDDMATYAAMVEIVDDGIGAIVKALSRHGMLDNTIFIFLSDNGATRETGRTMQLMANLSNTPYRCYKQWCLNGGIYSPLIISHGGNPDWANIGGWSPQRAHIIDLLPTCMEFASARYPSAQFGHANLPGMSLVKAKENVDSVVPRTLYYEHQSSCAIIDGDWKLVRYDSDTPWLLFNLATDPFEQNDLSAQQPEKQIELETKWTTWANDYNVFPLENLPWGDRIDHYIKLNPDQSGTSHK